MTMEHIALRNNELLQALLAKVTMFESDMSNIRALIQEKINPKRKEYLDDLDMESMFGLSYTSLNNLHKKNLISRYKLGGKMSKSFYKYSEIIDQIEKGLIAPTKKIAS